MNIRAAVLISFCIFGLPAMMITQTDEVQVYDGEIAAPGIFNLVVHNNVTPKGRAVPDYPGAIVANHSYQGVSLATY